jgi:hypothetical protein
VPYAPAQRHGRTGRERTTRLPSSR